MNKRFKLLLVMLLIIPCMLFFTGCKNNADAKGEPFDEVAYQLWLNNGNEGTMEDFLESIINADSTLEYLAGVAAFVSTGQEFIDALQAENPYIILSQSIQLNEVVKLDGDISKVIFGQRKSINAGFSVSNGAELVIYDLNIYPANASLISGDAAVYVGENASVKMYNCDVVLSSVVKAKYAIYLDQYAAQTYLKSNTFHNYYTGTDSESTFALFTDFDKASLAQNTFRCEGKFAIGFGENVTQKDINLMFTTQISRSWFMANSDTVVYAYSHNYSSMDSIITFEAFIEWLKSGDWGQYFNGVID